MLLHEIEANYKCSIPIMFLSCKCLLYSTYTVHVYVAKQKHSNLVDGLLILADLGLILHEQTYVAT